MFYSFNALSKNGPLARIWLAAHWERKLTKAAVCGVNVKDAVDEVKKPDQGMALRTTGHLLLGIVRIYARQCKFLLTDVGEIVQLLKANFKPAVERIELEENDEPLSDPHLQPQAQRGGVVDEIVANIEEDENAVLPTRPADITMNEEEVFDFDDRRSRSRSHPHVEQVQGAVADININQPEFEMAPILDAESRHLAREGSLFGNERPGSLFANEEGSFRFEVGRDGTPRSGLSGTPQPFHVNELADIELMDENVMPMPCPEGVAQLEDTFGAELARAGPVSSMFEPMDVDVVDQQLPKETIREPFADLTNTTIQPPQPEPEVTAGPADLTGFPQAPADPGSFALEPLNLSELPVRHRARKQRRLIVDTVTRISDEDFRRQPDDYRDTLRVGSHELGPPSRKLMECKEADELNQLMVNPGNKWLFGAQVRHAYLDQLQVGLPPEDSNETLLSGHLRNEMEMAQNIIESRPTTPQANFDLEPIETPQAPSDFIEQPSELFQHNLTGPGAEMEIPVTPGPFFDNAGFATSTPFPHAGQAQANFADESLQDVGSRGSSNTMVSQASSVEKKDLLGRIVLALTEEDTEEVPLSQLISKEEFRKSAARKFFAILEARKNREVKLRQEEPFGEIFISADENLSNTSPTMSTLS